MAPKQDSDDDMDDITDEMEDNDDIENILQSLESAVTPNDNSNLIARRRIEELQEERRLREQIGDYLDYDF